MVFSFPLLNFPDCHFAICCQVELNYLICLGIMMTLAWVLFAFVGLFTARYMREVWEPRQLLGEKAWFTVSTVKKKKFKQGENNCAWGTAWEASPEGFPLRES